MGKNKYLKRESYLKKLTIRQYWRSQNNNLFLQMWKIMTF